MPGLYSIKQESLRLVQVHAHCYTHIASIRQIVLYCRNNPDFLDMWIIFVPGGYAELTLSSLPNFTQGTFRV